MFVKMHFFAKKNGDIIIFFNMHIPFKVRVTHQNYTKQPSNTLTKEILFEPVQKSRCPSSRSNFGEKKITPNLPYSRKAHNIKTLNTGVKCCFVGFKHSYGFAERVF